jgi:hypothetical protein
MRKPTVYLDTSVISAFWYEGGDVAMLARQLKTREWWEIERRHFTVTASAFGEAELRAGVFPRQAECIRMIERLPFLRMSQTTRKLIGEFVNLRIVPLSKSADAGHLAIAASAAIDYLLTWNYAHMANPVVQSKLDRLCQKSELRAPLLVSPESIPQVRYGQPIRREKPQ